MDSIVTTFSNMDLNLLRVFDAIVVERSLTKAGARLHLSQPAVSYALGRLRSIFDDPLFIRTKDGMQPTPAALELSKSVSRALQAVQDALRHAEKFEPETSTRIFHVAMSDVASMMYLPFVNQQLNQLAPYVRLHVEQVPALGVDEGLRTGRMDLAIGNLPALKASTQHALIFEEPYVCITRTRGGLPEGEYLSLEQFLTFSHIAVQSLECGRNHIEDAYSSLGISRKIALSIPNFSMLPSILARSDLAVTLPLRIARWFNEGHGLRMYALPVTLPSYALSLYWHQDFSNDQGGQWLRKIFSVVDH
jgi:DNA-binding transcriptional LysR family regulator